MWRPTWALLPSLLDVVYMHGSVCQVQTWRPLGREGICRRSRSEYSARGTWELQHQQRSHCSVHNWRKRERKQRAEGEEVRVRQSDFRWVHFSLISSSEKSMQVRACNITFVTFLWVIINMQRQSPLHSILKGKSHNWTIIDQILGV